MEVDLIIKNARVYNAYFKRFLHRDVAILGNKFFHISSTGSMELTSKKVLDAKGKYMVPGLIDIHMHIESSMTTPMEFAKAVVTQGVTTVVADPHEIANVFGLEGIEAMLDIKCNHIIDIFYGIPSSVPSTSFALETSGGSIDSVEVERLLERQNIVCLGEVMNFKDLVENKDSKINNIISVIKDKRPELLIEGHCPKISGLELSRYIYSGVDGDHTHQTVESLQEKIEKGMFMEIQEKSMTKENLEYLMENNLYEHFAFVTDDVMADSLREGHLNRLVKKAMSLGMSPEMAVYAATYTPAMRMKLRDRGSIAPGKIADFLIIDDIDNFNIEAVYKNGIEASKDHDSTCSGEAFPKHFYESVKIGFLNASDFMVKAPKAEGKVTCRIMKVERSSTFTEEVQDDLNIIDGYLNWQDSENCLIGIFERHGINNNRAYGLVTGEVIKKGAVATTYSHDSHNLLVMGRNSEDMTLASNWVIEHNGGICVVHQGKILAALELPVAGILSEEPINILGGKLKEVREALRALGYKHNNEIMSLSTLSLPVSPALKISDKGLIRVKEQKIVSLFCE